MRVVRLVTSQTLPERGSEVVLGARAAHYLRRVMRCQPGREVVLVGADGAVRAARVLRYEGGQVRLQVWCPLPVLTEAGPTVHVIFAVLRGHGVDGLVRMATELGAAHFQPIVTRRTVARPTGRGDAARLARWQTIARQAVHQCGRGHTPPVAPPASLADYLARPSSADLRIVLWEQARERPLAEVLAAFREGEPSATPQVDLLFGPEGGLDEAEVRAAESAGFVPAWLGERILRAETAPIAVMAIVQYALGGLQ